MKILSLNQDFFTVSKNQISFYFSFFRTFCQWWWLRIIFLIWKAKNILLEKKYGEETKNGLDFPMILVNF